LDRTLYILVSAPMFFFLKWWDLFIGTFEHLLGNGRSLDTTNQIFMQESGTFWAAAGFGGR